MATTQDEIVIERKLVAVQLRGEQVLRLAELVNATGWNQSEVIRQLIDNATVRSAQVRTEIALRSAAHEDK